MLQSFYKRHTNKFLLGRFQLDSHNTFNCLHTKTKTKIKSISKTKQNLQDRKLKYMTKIKIKKQPLQVSLNLLETRNPLIENTNKLNHKMIKKNKSNQTKEKKKKKKILHRVLYLINQLASPVTLFDSVLMQPSPQPHTLTQ